MTNTKILRVVAFYEGKANNLLKTKTWEDSAKLKHILDVCNRIRELVQERGDENRVHKRIGFIQGVLWGEGLFSESELRGHLVSTKDEIREEYAGHSLTQYSACPACGDLDGCHKWRKLERAVA